MDSVGLDTGAFSALVVDDVAVNRLMLSTMLSRMGCNDQRQASDGAEAISLFAQQQPDIVVLDAHMPGIDGFGVASEIRRMADKWVPIIFVSADTTNEGLVKGMRSGGDDFLSKPIDFEVLRSKVVNLILRKRMADQIDEQNKQLQVFKSRIQEERDLAVQLINQVSAIDKIDDPLVRFHLQAAEHFSGDLIFVARTPDKRLHVLLADSSGHGLTAALAVIPLTQPFRQMTAKGFDISSIASEINRRVRDYLRLPRFVAAILVSLDVEQRMIQVWNGGCPPVLLTTRERGAVVHRFKSRHLPLGVLAPDEFDNSIEHYACGEEDGRLFLCTDGVTELPDSRGGHQGLQTLLEKVQCADSVDFFDSLVATLEAELGDDEQSDDIALIQLDCSVNGCSEDCQDDSYFQVSPIKDQSYFCDAQEDERPQWDFSVTLYAHQLRRLEVVPFLLGIAGQLEGASNNNLFIILSELFNNALEHGLLMLDSKIKSEVNGMERYFVERELRLANLEEGSIEIGFSRLANPTVAECKNCSRQLLRVRVRDSGIGFDHTQKIKDLESVTHHGRGIPLLHQLCGNVKYLGSGAEVVALVDVGKFECSLSSRAT